MIARAGAPRPRYNGSPMTQFSGRTVLITGASGGLGRAVVQAFADREATVFAVARSAEDAPPTGRVTRVAADLTTVEGARRAAAAAGRVDALVHLVGGFAGGDPVQQTGDDTWMQMMNLNLHAAFYMIRAVLPAMIENGRGRIVAVSSRTGLEPAAGLSAYGVSKAGLNALIRTVALETKNTGVTANAVLPSIIDTSANRRAMPSADYSRWVRPEAIAEAICWLAGDSADSISGALIPVYGRA
jgi:NAD(P)-dependent dehydrogenase (short-subunit alcohol dehydrogenase family)